MGRADDSMAAVDTQGRVKGIQGLRVVDASIFQSCRAPIRIFRR
jgi:5-(hydroxymethyl)furfural/furfural oxidase